MARPQKKGIDYFSLDVDFFSDKKIKILKARYGSDGIEVYLYLLCEIYRENGYYITFDDDYRYIIADDLNMNYDTIGQIINFLVKRSLFDDKLFNSDKVLTSHSIQKRFQEAVKTRASKTAIEINYKIWLLNEDETESYILNAKKYNSSEKNSSNSEKNHHCSEEKLHKVKESKVKENKINTTTIKAYSHYEQNIGIITMPVCERISYYMKLGFEDEVICEAINDAVLSNARNWKYIDKILLNCENDKAFTIDRYKARKVEFANKKEVVSNATINRNTGKANDWGELPGVIRF